MNKALAVAAFLFALPAVAQTAGNYAGEELREIKALSPQEQSDLLAGKGMGLARAGELNHHPGPAHVLEIREKLGLAPGQIVMTEASFRRMAAAAKPLGTEIVARERDLDMHFQRGTMTPSDLVAKTEAIGLLHGRLRAVHLAAHLEMRLLLSPTQIAAYDTLRGYAGGDAPSPSHGHRMQPG